jgi:hypothetical protein
MIQRRFGYLFELGSCRKCGFNSVIGAIEAALAPLIEGLTSDGYIATVTDHGDVAVLNIAAGPGACAECLVPLSVMVPMVTLALRDAGLSHVAEVRYPKES